jgi:hypothetical protein
METLEHDELKLFSQRAITIATLFGGPLAAGYLIYINLKGLGKSKGAKISLYLGIVFTVIIFSLLFSLPQQIVDSVPNQLLPLIYTGVIYLIVERILGKDLKEHKAKNGLFYSAWKAAGIGAVCTLILVVGIFAIFSLNAAKFDAKSYDEGIKEIVDNEGVAVKVYNHLNTSPIDSLILELNKDIEIWNKNLLILNRLDKMDEISGLAVKQDKKFRKYINYRIEVYNLMKKALIEKTDKYKAQIEDLHRIIKMTINEK